MGKVHVITYYTSSPTFQFFIKLWHLVLIKYFAVVLVAIYTDCEVNMCEMEEFTENWDLHIIIMYVPVNVLMVTPV